LVPIKNTRLKSTEHFHILLCSGTNLHPQVEGIRMAGPISHTGGMKMHINV